MAVNETKPFDIDVDISGQSKVQIAMSSDTDKSVESKIRII